MSAPIKPHEPSSHAAARAAGKAETHKIPTSRVKDAAIEALQAALGTKDKQQITNALKRVVDDKKMMVPSLMKRSDLGELEQIFQKVYKSCCHSEYDPRRYLNIAFRPSTTLEGLCTDILQSLATAKIHRHENGEKLKAELAKLFDDRRHGFFDDQTLDAVQHLLVTGADFDLASYGTQLLFLALKKKRDPLVKALIQAGVDVNQENRHGSAPLHCARTDKAIKALIAAGADVHKRNSSTGNTPLLDNLNYLSAQSIQALIEAGANAQPVLLKVLDPPPYGRDGSTPDILKMLIEKGFGRALMEKAIQHDRSVRELSTFLSVAYTTMNVDELIKDLHPKVSLACIYQLIESNKEVMHTFLKSIMEAKFRESKHAFSLEPAADLSQLTLKTAAGSTTLPKNQFYEMWMEENGDLPSIQERILDLPTRKIAEHWGFYQQTVARSDLQEHPQQALHNLCTEFSKSIQSNMQIEFKDEEGSDAGGVTKQFIQDLVTGIMQKMNFQKCDNGLNRPRLQAPFTFNEADKQVYREFGQLLMFCLNARVECLIGMSLDQGVFTALTKMDQELVAKDFDSLDFAEPAIFHQLFAIYKDVYSNIDKDQEMIHTMERYLSLSPSTPDATLQQAYAVVAYDDPIQDLDIDYNVAKIKQHLPEIQAAIYKNIAENMLRPTLAPIHQIAKGMSEAPFNERVSFRRISRMNPFILSQRLQGSVGKDIIINKIQFDDDIPDTIRQWLKNWITDVDTTTLQLFLYALSGSSSLGKESKIRIQFGPYLLFHTCYNTVELNCSAIKSEKEFRELLEESLAMVKANAAIDLY